MIHPTPDPLRVHLERMLMAQDGVPLNAIQFGQWVDEARAALAAAPQPAPVPADERAVMIEVIAKEFRDALERHGEVAMPSSRQIADALLAHGLRLPDREAAPPPDPDQKEVKAGQVWEHHSGRRYRVLFLTNNEGDGVREKYPVTVVYEGDNGRRWSGPLADWHRRMTLVDEAPQPAPADREALVGEIRGALRAWPLLTGGQGQAEFIANALLARGLSLGPDQAALDAAERRGMEIMRERAAKVADENTFGGGAVANAIRALPIKGGDDAA